MFVKKMIAYGGIALMMVLMLMQLWLGPERARDGLTVWTRSSWTGTIVYGVMLALIFGSFYILFMSRK